MTQPTQRDLDRLKAIIARLLPHVYCDRCCACAENGRLCEAATAREEARRVLQEGRILETCGL